MKIHNQLSLYLCLPLTLSLFIYLSHAHPLSLSPSISSPSIYLFLYTSTYRSFVLSVSLSVSLSLSFFLSFALYHHIKCATSLLPPPSLSLSLVFIFLSNIINEIVSSGLVSYLSRYHPLASRLIKVRLHRSSHILVGIVCVRIEPIKKILSYLNKK